ncbi:MAG: hypothetical protein LBB75_08800 [Oscillospiraceae bacterium]|jgi:hypothetical protein|nr:hypothetical protein [Oscillospiraceae bacterium]
MNSFFLRIEVAVLAFLLLLFPWAESLGLGFMYARRTVDHAQIAAEVVAAINARDIAKLQSMMCLDINEYVDGLPAKIGEFCDAVLALGNGRITDYSLDIRKDILRMSRPEFGQMQQDIIIIKSVGYSLPIAWAICKGPEAGIRRMALVDETIRELVDEIKATQYVA